MKRIVLLACLTTACDGFGGGDGAKCSLPGDVDIRILSEPPVRPVTTEFVLRGTVSAPNDVTVYRIEVNGVAATNAGTNFSSWTASLPIQLLADQAEGGMVTLVPRLYTNCSATPLAPRELVIPVDDTPGIAVDEITKLEATPPDNQGFVPATGMVTADVVIEANKEAVGASVALVAVGGMVSPAAVTLEGNGVDPARASAKFWSTTPGVALLTATAKGRSRSTQVTVAGPPTFSAGPATLPAGNRLTSTVRSAGRIAYCVASPAAGVHVVSGTHDVMAGTSDLEQVPGGISLEVSVDGTLAAATQTTVRCFDAYNQVGEALFKAERQAPPIPPIVVTSLVPTAAPLNGVSYLPSTLAVHTIVTITGNPQAAGASVSLVASLGSTVTPDHVTLTGNGTAAAVAYALFSSTARGNATITASAGGQLGQATIPVVGPPTFAPDGFHIPAGQSRGIAVLQDAPARSTSCQATPAAGIHVTSGMADLMAAPAGVDQTGDTVIDITVRIDPGTADDTTTIVTCRDVFGQVGTAAFVVGP